jgi:predicted TIM-barrel fold metal-dependent hydrolase
MLDPAIAPTLVESRLPVIDAHHHFWDLDNNYHPWLCDVPMIAFRYGDYSSLKRNYLADHYRADVGDINLAGSVYVEAEWHHEDPIGESRWVHRIHEQSGLPTAMVAQAWLDQPNADSLIATQAAFPMVRSVRHKPVGAATIAQFESGQRSVMHTSQWRRGFSTLARHGLHFDLQTPYWHLPEARQLADDFPDTTIILNHTGLPADRSDTGLARWGDAMSELASAPNVVVKISGLGMPAEQWTTASVAGIVNQTIDMFGSDRCMFASNFPVDGLCATYQQIFQSYYEAVVGRSAADKQALFSGTAQRIYRL